jgi:hypothetical protein
VGDWGFDDGPVCRTLRAESWLVLFWIRFVEPPEKTQGGIVEIETFAAALPITDIVQQRRVLGVARDSQDQSAVGTADRFARHSV